MQENNQTNQRQLAQSSEFKAKINHLQLLQPNELSLEKRQRSTTQGSSEMPAKIKLKQSRVKITKKEEAPFKKVLLIYFSGSAGAASNFEICKGYLRDKMKENQYLFDYKYKVQIQGAQEFLVTPVLANGLRVHYSVYEFARISHSVNASFDEIKQIPEKIREVYGSYDAFIVICGFDVICYVSTLVSFMMENLSKLVIFTGGYFPISSMRNDIVTHLIESFSLVSMAPNLQEVVIVCNHEALRANRAIKLREGDLSAVGSPNYSPLVSINIKLKFREYLFLPVSKHQFTIWTDLSSRVGVLKYHNLLSQEAIEYELSNPYFDGFVIESYGASNLPQNHQILNIFRRAALEKNKVFVNIGNSVKKANKSVMKDFLEGFEIFHGGDMTTDAAIAKLAYLLSKRYSREQIKRWIGTDMRGELTEIKKDNQFSAEELSFTEVVRCSVQEYYPSHQLHAFVSSLDDKIVSMIHRDTSYEDIEHWFYPFKEEIQQETAFRVRIAAVIERNCLLHRAVKLKNESLYKYFLGFEVDKDKEDQKGCSPFFYAIANCDKAAVQCLVSKGCKIVCLVADIFQLLIRQLARDNLGFFELLYHIEFRESLKELVDEEGRNALHLAAVLKAQQCYKYLIQKFRLDGTWRDVYGKSAEEYK